MPNSDQDFTSLERTSWCFQERTCRTCLVYSQDKNKSKVRTGTVWPRGNTHCKINVLIYLRLCVWQHSVRRLILLSYLYYGLPLRQSGNQTLWEDGSKLLNSVGANLKFLPSYETIHPFWHSMCVKPVFHLRNSHVTSHI